MPGRAHESIVHELCSTYGAHTTGFSTAVRQYLEPVLDRAVRPDAWLHVPTGLVAYEVEVHCHLTPERVMRWACLWAQFHTDGVSLELWRVSRDLDLHEVNLSREFSAAVAERLDPASLERDFGDCLMFSRRP